MNPTAEPDQPTDTHLSLTTSDHYAPSVAVFFTGLLSRSSLPSSHLAPTDHPRSPCDGPRCRRLPGCQWNAHVTYRLDW
jgi:hypothetical protein